jgi:uncharacterized membrane protein
VIKENNFMSTQTLSKCIRRFWIHVLDWILWGMLFLYVMGGVHIHGKLRLTYMHDIWVGCAIFYGIPRFFNQIRLNDTSFGRAWFEMVENWTQAFTQKRFQLIFSGSWPAKIFSGVICYSGFLFFLVPILNYWGFGNFVWDFGLIENVIYNAATSGQFITHFLIRDDEVIRYFPNNHLNFGVYLFAFIYRFFPHGEILLFLQSLALALALIPLYRLGELILPREIPRWFSILLYLFWDPIYRMNIWDIHEAPFLIPFAFWAFYYIERRSLGWAIFYMILMAMWREDAWWLVTGMSIYAGIRTQKWLICAPLALVSFLIFPMHAFCFNQVNTLDVRYPYLGKNFQSAISIILKKPWIFVEIFLENRLFFMRLMLSSGGGIFLLGGAAMIPLVLPLAVVGLSQYEGMLSWNNHYVGSFAAPLFFASLHGWARLYPWIQKRYGHDRASALLSCSIALCFSQLFFNLPGALKGAFNMYKERRCLYEVMKEIPPDAPVIASGWIAPKLTHRLWIASPFLHQDLTEATWIAVGELGDLKAGLNGKHPGKPWQDVHFVCGTWVGHR